MERDARARENSVILGHSRYPSAFLPTLSLPHYDHCLFVSRAARQSTRTRALHRPARNRYLSGLCARQRRDVRASARASARSTRRECTRCKSTDPPNDNGTRGTRVCKYDRVITRGCRARQAPREIGGGGVEREPNTLSPACNLAPSDPPPARTTPRAHSFAKWSTPPM